MSWSPFQRPVGHFTSLKKHLFFAHFWLDYLCFVVFVVLGDCFVFICFVLLLIHKSSLYTLDVNPLSGMRFANIFFNSVGCLFILFTLSFAIWKLFSCNTVPSVYFCFCFLCFWCEITKTIPYQCQGSFPLLFSFSRLIASVLQNYVGLAWSYLRFFNTL